MKQPTCTLCDSEETRFYYKDNFRSYYRCSVCRLIFVPPKYRLSAGKEKERYDLHENDPEDRGYRRFLSRLAEPLDEMLPPGSEGLDFGSGPGPALPRMLEERGHSMNIYDPFYEDDTAVFNRKYDFITATEVVEHLHDPGEELDRLWSLLRPPGYLGIMTGLVTDREAFQNWHYIRDKTHVAFFSEETFEWLAERWNAGLCFIAGDVIILQKEL